MFAAGARTDCLQRSAAGAARAQEAEIWSDGSNAAIDTTDAAALHLQFLDPSLQGLDLGGGGGEFSAEGVLLPYLGLEGIFCLRILAQIGRNLCLKRRNMGERAIGLRALLLQRCFGCFVFTGISCYGVAELDYCDFAAAFLGGIGPNEVPVREPGNQRTARQGGDACDCQYDRQFV